MKVHFLFKKETREENLPDLLGADRSFSLFCSTKQTENSLLSTITTRMKHLIHLLSLHFLFLLCSCSTSEKEYYLFTSFHEPANAGLRYLYSEDGIHWDSIAGTWLKPELGANIMRDPSIWRDKDGTFHLVWTIAWKKDRGFGYASSKDLINWSEEKRIPVMDHIPETYNVWAPELFYDDVKKQYMIIWSSLVPDSTSIGFSEENKDYYRLYYVTTKNFNTFSEAKLLYDPGFSCIDGYLLKRAPDNYVMVIKDNRKPNHSNLKITFSKNAEGPFIPASDSFTEEWSEGPCVTKVGNDYMIYYDLYRQKIYGATKTRDFVHFTNMTDSIHIPKHHKHGTICKVPESIIEHLKEIQKQVN